MNKLKKALQVLSGDCSNRLIRSDMFSVAQNEILGLENSLDSACNHNEELMAENSLLLEALQDIKDHESMKIGVPYSDDHVYNTAYEALAKARGEA